jgi:5-methyltetrahydrofolate--homocysteine methyltransferase
MGTNLDTISQGVRNGDHELVASLVKEALADKTPVAEILENGLVAGLRALGELFKTGEVFLPEILISVRAMRRGLEELNPYLTSEDTTKKGTIVLGTVEGDLHDIGKNLVGMLLAGNGYNVIDVGVDVSVDVFLNSAQEHNADFVAMSGLLTTTVPYFRTVIDALKEAGLKDKVMVMVGGAPVTRDYADEIGAEGFAEDCVKAVDEADRLMALRHKGGSV